MTPQNGRSGRILNENFDFRDHVSNSTADNTTKSIPFKAEKNA